MARRVHGRLPDLTSELSPAGITHLKKIPLIFQVRSCLNNWNEFVRRRCERRVIFTAVADLSKGRISSQTCCRVHSVKVGTEARDKLKAGDYSKLFRERQRKLVVRVKAVTPSAEWIAFR